MLGEVIHGYRVDRALSADKGGFGDVYFATHVESGAEAVVKVLKPEMSAHRDIVTRFFNEARAAASVHHPGIVQIHNVGYHRERAYLLMERLRGEDLETRLKAGPLPVDRAIVFLRQAAGAVGAAHDRGIVHRDLKPANLFVVADPDVVGGERVKVLDFGIAKLTADAAGSKTQGVFGTPAYMSPEQCASSGAVDARADLYSLGCILYELVCGRPPFGHGGLELIAAHLRDAPPPPRAIAPWVPPAVEQLILRLLEKQPERRPPSCAALIAALDEVAAAAGIVVTNAPRMASGQVATAPGNPQLQFATTSPEPRTAFAGPSEPGMYAPGAGVLQQVMPLASPSPTSSTRRARRFRRWLWIVAVLGASVGTAVALLVPSGGKHPAHGAGGSAVPKDADVVAAATLDAAPPDSAAPDAAVAVDAIDAAVVAMNTRDAGSDESSPTTSEPVSMKPTADRARTNADIAAQLNHEGTAAMYRDDIVTGARKFEQAIALDPKANYFFNLCVARVQNGQLGAALATCRAVDGHHPSDALRSKTARLIARIQEEARKQDVALPPDSPERKPVVGVPRPTQAGPGSHPH